MGLGDSLRSVAATGALIARQRLELAALDVQDELGAWARLLGGILAVAVLAALALGALGAVVVIALWDVARVAAVVCVALAYVITAVIAWQRLLRAWAAKPPFMAATIDELRRDSEQVARS
jgi:uncharacterized membrane protein YqjE